MSAVQYWVNRNRPTYLTPSIIAQTGTFHPSTTASWVVTPPSTPVAGNMLIITCGGVPTGGFTNVTSPGWFTAFTNTTFAQTILYKIATTSEPANYTVTVNGGATIAGGWTYMEWYGLNGGQDPFKTVRMTGSSTGSRTTTAIDIDYQCVGFSLLTKSNTVAWTPVWSSGGTNIITPSGQHKISYKIFNSTTYTLAETMTWGSGAVTTNTIDLALIRVKTIYP